MNRIKPGRPLTSNLIRVTPEFREKPDIEKLARALIAIARNMAEKEQTVNRKGDTVA